VVPKLCFASADALGTIRFWNLDIKESLFCLKVPDVRDSYPIRCMFQIEKFLIVVQGNDLQPSHIVLWSLEKFQIVQQVDNADLNEINKMCLVHDFSHLEFKKNGKSNIIKIWMID
jgi:WD40 repeat protein